MFRVLSLQDDSFGHILYFYRLKMSLATRYGYLSVFAGIKENTLGPKEFPFLSFFCPLPYVYPDTRIAKIRHKRGKHK